MAVNLRLLYSDQRSQNVQNFLVRLTHLPLRLSQAHFALRTVRSLLVSNHLYLHTAQFFGSSAFSH